MAKPQELLLEFALSGPSLRESLEAVVRAGAASRSLSARLEFRDVRPIAELAPFDGTGGPRIVVIEPEADIVQGADIARVVAEVRDGLATTCEHAHGNGTAVVLASVFRRTSIPSVGTAPFVGYREMASRVNLALYEVSCTTGAYVLDVDRILAEIGERTLRADPARGASAVADRFGRILFDDGLLDFALEIVGDAA